MLPRYPVARSKASPNWIQLPSLSQVVPEMLINFTYVSWTVAEIFYFKSIPQEVRCRNGCLFHTNFPFTSLSPSWNHNRQLSALEGLRWRHLFGLANKSTHVQPPQSEVFSNYLISPRSIFKMIQEMDFSGGIPPTPNPWLQSGQGWTYKACKAEGKKLQKQDCKSFRGEQS